MAETTSSAGSHASLPQRRLWLFRAAAMSIPLALGGAVLALLVATGVIDLSGRIYLYEPGHERTGHKYLYDPLLGWKNIPNWRATTRGKPLTINSKGLRDRDYTYDKPPGVTRIVVLGDSFAWGYGVGDDDIFTEVLERRLEKDHPGTFEVINTGVSGWGTDQEYLFLKEEGFRYQPDVVVLAFFLLNDPLNNASSRQYGLDKPIFLDTDLTLANVPVPKPGSGAPVLRAKCHPIELTAAIIASMARDCDNRGAMLIVMKFGSFLRPDDDETNRIARLLEARIRAMPAVGYLDLDKAFADRRIETEDLLRGNDDGHWNAYGHSVVADVLREYLEQPNT